MLNWRRDQQTRSCRGFTLIEIMVAVSIFFAGSLALLGLSALGVAALDSSRALSKANELAQAKMEEILSAPYELVVPDAFPEESYGQVPGYENYSRTVTIEQDYPSDRMKSITVEVFWKIRGRDRTYNIRLGTIMSEAGGY